jgi:Uma2 family endonuclease
MPTELENPPVWIDFLPKWKQWTRTELERLESLELIDTSDFELVDGELFSRLGRSREHVYMVSCLTHHLGGIFGFRRVNPNCPIFVTGDAGMLNQPQPDVVVMNEGFRDFRSRVPGAEDLAIVVEVADTTFVFDASIKAGLYARAGIVEYWVLDVHGRRLLSHRRPVKGVYESVKVFGRDEQILPLESPGGALDLKKIFDLEA